MLFYYLFLGIIFILSLIICWEDVRHKKIRNNVVVAGFILGALLFIISFAFDLVNFDYMKQVIANTVSALVVALVIWKAGFWPAGDSKYFVLMVFLLPLQYYSRTYLNYFPAFVLLVNIFMVFLLFLICKALFLALKDLIIFLFKTSAGEKIKRLRVWAGSVLRRKYSLAGIGRVLLSMIFALAISFILGKFYFKSHFSLLTFIQSMIFFGLMGVLVEYYISNFVEESILPVALPVHSNLALETKQLIEKDKILAREMGELRPDGLDIRQVDVLQEYSIKNNLQKLFIYKTIPFSLWIFIGTIVTIFLQGNILQIFRK